MMLAAPVSLNTTKQNDSVGTTNTVSELTKLLEYTCVLLYRIPAELYIFEQNFVRQVKPIKVG